MFCSLGGERANEKSGDKKEITGRGKGRNGSGMDRSAHANGTNPLSGSLAMPLYLKLNHK